MNRRFLIARGIMANHPHNIVLMKMDEEDADNQDFVDYLSNHEDEMSPEGKAAWDQTADLEDADDVMSRLGDFFHEPRAWKS